MVICIILCFLELLICLPGIAYLSSCYYSPTCTYLYVCTWAIVYISTLGVNPQIAGTMTLLTSDCIDDFGWMVYTMLCCELIHVSFQTQLQVVLVKCPAF